MIVKFSDDTYGVKFNGGYVDGSGKVWHTQRYIYEYCRFNFKIAKKIYRKYVSLEPIPVCFKCGKEL